MPLQEVKPFAKTLTHTTQLYSPFEKAAQLYAKKMKLKT